MGKAVDKLPKKKRVFLENLSSCIGIITAACKMSNISRRTFYNWRDQKDEEGDLFREGLEMVMDEQGDFVESALFKNIKKGDPSSIIFYCKTKLRNRGYSERTEQDVNIMNTPQCTVKELFEDAFGPDGDDDDTTDENDETNVD